MILLAGLVTIKSQCHLKRKQKSRTECLQIRNELDLDALLSQAATECEFSVQVDGASLLQELPLI